MVRWLRGVPPTLSLRCPSAGNGLRSTAGGAHAGRELVDAEGRFDAKLGVEQLAQVLVSAERLAPIALGDQGLDDCSMCALSERRGGDRYESGFDRFPESAGHRPVVTYRFQCVQAKVPVCLAFGLQPGVTPSGEEILVEQSGRGMVETRVRRRLGKSTGQCPMPLDVDRDADLEREDLIGDLEQRVTQRPELPESGSKIGQGGRFAGLWPQGARHLRAPYGVTLVEPQQHQHALRWWGDRHLASRLQQPEVAEEAKRNPVRPLQATGLTCVEAADLGLPSTAVKHTPCSLTRVSRDGLRAPWTGPSYLPTMKPPHLTRDEARRIAISAQLLDSSRPDDLVAMAEQL